MGEHIVGPRAHPLRLTSWDGCPLGGCYGIGDIANAKALRAAGNHVILT